MKERVLSVLLLFLCLLGCRKPPSPEPDEFPLTVPQRQVVQVVKFYSPYQDLILAQPVTDTSTCLVMKPLSIPNQVADLLKYNEKSPYIALNDNYYLVDWKRSWVVDLHRCGERWNYMYAIVDERWDQLKNNNRSWPLSHLVKERYGGLSESYLFTFYQPEGGSLWMWSKNDTLKNCEWFREAILGWNLEAKSGYPCGYLQYVAKETVSTETYASYSQKEKDAYWQHVRDADSLMIKVIKPILNEMIEKHALGDYAFELYKLN